MINNNYIPALKFHWLTKMYDGLISTFMPEVEFKTAIIKNANIQNSYTVLDFGIGTATLSIMANKANPNAVYKGIDIDDKVLGIAQQKIENANANIELIKYDGSILPFDDNHFDRIMSSLVIHHLTTEHKKFAFCEFKRVLKPNGELHIADWGKPTNLFMRLLFHIVQLLDGYKTTNDNVKGLIPVLLSNEGFKQVKNRQYFNTVLGTVQLYSTIK
jgi:ubiquinone/menaquinone biosynthesis C-methylase UbiE